MKIVACRESEVELQKTQKKNTIQKVTFLFWIVFLIGYVMLFL